MDEHAADLGDVCSNTLQQYVDVCRASFAPELGADRPHRYRRPTEQGMQYQMELLDSRRKKIVNRIVSKMKKVGPLQEDYNNVQHVQEEMSNIDHLFFELMEVQAKFHLLISDDNDRKESSEWMNGIDTKVFEFKQAINKWLQDANVVVDALIKEPNIDVMLHITDQCGGGTSTRKRLNPCPNIQKSTHSQKLPCSARRSLKQSLVFPKANSVCTEFPSKEKLQYIHNKAQVTLKKIPSNPSRILQHRPSSVKSSPSVRSKIDSHYNSRWRS